jgi:hypothetical protein
MKMYVLAVLSILLCNACSIMKSDTCGCKKQVKSSLKSLSKSISMDKETKIYTVYYSALPEISKNIFERLRDSIENVEYIPQNYDMIKHHLLCTQLINLKNTNCKIKLKDVRHFFGVESETGTNKGKVETLFYYFNTNSHPQCYENIDKYKNLWCNTGISEKMHCSLLSFSFDEQQILIDVSPQSY